MAYDTQYSHGNGGADEDNGDTRSERSLCYVAVAVALALAPPAAE